MEREKAALEARLIQYQEEVSILYLTFLQCCSSGSGSPWIVRIDVGRQKCPTKIEKVKKCHVLKCCPYMLDPDPHLKL